MTTKEQSLERLIDWSRWTANASGTLGIRGEVYPNDCPRGTDQCDDCRSFMGHRKEPPAYVGDGVRFCCAARLSSLKETSNEHE